MLDFPACCYRKVIFQLAAVASRENKFSMLTREIKKTTYIERNKYSLYNNNN